MENHIKYLKTIICFMVFIFFSLNIINAQNQLTGVIKDKDLLKPIQDAYVLIKDLNNTILNYTTTNKDGNYSITLESDLTDFYVEVIVLSHITLKQKFTINSLKEVNYIQDFQLKERVTSLDEVLIEGKKRPITIKKDTTSYNINNFKDGTERVVEDLLKKLPGISIKPSGQILFKGKAVTNLLLDGDDIFNENYTIGSKNISADIIEKIDAIEDYNKNSLLKNIRTSQDIAINLTLKKGLSDLSGNGEIGLGIKNRKQIKSNLIAVSKKIKGFAIANHNNIGQNNSPYNITSNEIDLSSLNLFNKKSFNILNTNRSSNFLSNERVQVNNNYYGSLNGLYKINNKTKVKLNYNFYRDLLFKNEKNNIVYNLDSSLLNINTSETLNKIPVINDIDINISNSNPKKSLLVFKGKYNFNFVKNSSSAFNNNTLLKNNTQTEDYFFNNDLEYTSKISKRKVIQLKGNLSINKIPQNLSIQSNEQNISQTVNSSKSIFDVNSNFLYKSLKNNETSIVLGFINEKNNFHSLLSGLNTNLANQNDISFENSKQYLYFKQLFIFDKLELDSNIKTEYLKTNITNFDINYLDTSLIVFNAYFSSKYNLTKKGNIYFDYSLTNQIPEINNIYEGLILTGNRTLINNDFEFDLLDNHNLVFGYRINDFYNLFQLNFFARYSINKLGFINQLNLSENQDVFTQILATTNNKNKSLHSETEKYLHLFKTTFNFKTSYSKSNYQNIINDNEIRNNTNYNYKIDFGFRTGFQKNLNFENFFTFNNNFYVNNNNSFKLNSFQNDFKIKYVKNNFNFLLNSQFFTQLSKNTKNNEFFLDAHLSYKPKKTEYKLIIINFFNNDEFQNLTITDFSK
ncbi:MAG: hypothetical protein WBF67_08360, partial [Olleya sp.]